MLKIKSILPGQDQLGSAVLNLLRRQRQDSNSIRFTTNLAQACFHAISTAPVTRHSGLLGPDLCSLALFNFKCSSAHARLN